MREGDTVVLRRGKWVESRHRVHAVVVGSGGAPMLEVGDPRHLTFMRSAAKPFQALPLVEDGVVEALGFGAREVAIACGSHSGEPEHRRVVEGMLARAGFAPEALECGPDRPMDRAAADALLRAGGGPGSIYNDCSGKHAAMLALARHHGWETTGYVAVGHPVQRRMLDEIARWCDLPAASIGIGVDGCGVVCFALPLEQIGRGVSRLLARAAAGDSGPSMVVGAMAAEPFLVAGTGRLCTEVMEATGGTVVAKVGAEGVYIAGVREAGLGIALKVEDGSRRASEVALLSLLEEVGALSDTAREALADWMPPRTVANRRKEPAAHLALERNGEGSGGGVDSPYRASVVPGTAEEERRENVALTPHAGGLVAASAALASGDLDGLQGALEGLVRRGGAGRGVEEALLQAHLFAGFPAALNALAIWRAVSGHEAEPATVEEPTLWEGRGEALCRRIYGRAYDGLRENISALHPDLDRWMVVEGYGKVLGRDGLGIRERELCIVSILAVQGAGVQLHSHLRGALRVGCRVDEVTEALEIALRNVEPGLRQEMEAVWRAVQRRAAMEDGDGSPAPKRNAGATTGESEDVRR